MSEASERVRQQLALQVGSVEAPRPGELVATAPLADLPALADRVASSELAGRLVGVFAADARAASGAFSLHHLWALAAPRAFLRIQTRVEPSAPRFPSIAVRHPAANWFEREVGDFFGLVPDGHPNPMPVAVHDDWPEGEWPLRKDFPADRQPARAQTERHPFRPVIGEGVFQVPVGPVHAGIIEPGHFRFGVAGEPILDLQLRLFYVHKGTEKRFEALPWRHGLFLAESVSGDTVVGHALAYAHALERLTAVEIPPRARALRSVLLELERIDNHVADIGALATDVAFSVPASRAQTLRERLASLQERLFGTRLLRATVALGGMKRDLRDTARTELRDHLRALRPAFEALVTLLVDAGTFTDRVDGTGVLPGAAARDLGVVGPAGRASGLDLDLRRDHPHDAYADLRFEVPVEDGGDVRARFMVRAREVEQSLAILEQCLDGLPAGPVRVPLPDALPRCASALGWAEGWRGECVHWVETDERGELTRVKVLDPSFKNWPGLARAVPGNIIPDFPVINKSFNLSYSGNDR